MLVPVFIRSRSCTVGSGGRIHTRNVLGRLPGDISPGQAEYTLKVPFDQQFLFLNECSSHL